MSSFGSGEAWEWSEEMEIPAPFQSGVVTGLRGTGMYVFV